MEIRQNLISKLAVEENYSYLLELNDLMPDLLLEIRANILLKFFTLPDSWDNYLIYREDETIHMSLKENCNKSFFRFSIFIGSSDNNMYFGITGPWSNSIQQIEQLKSKAVESNLSAWSNWHFKYFNSGRDVFFNAIRKSLDLKDIVYPFHVEFFNICNNLKDDVEIINKKLLEN